MRLARYIERNMLAIVAEWEAFAATQLPAAATMQPLALRDHVEQILRAVVKDLDTAQDDATQEAKSLGRAPSRAGAPETAAQTHATLRAQSGFNINQLTAEYRALRASVLRLWMVGRAPQPDDLVDVIRFNEAIDQALAESVVFFTLQVDRSRNLLLGMLGHDMRSPLQTIQATAYLLSALNAGASVSEAAARLARSGERIKNLLEDLLDFGRTELGLGMPMRIEEVDVAGLFADELVQLRAAYPRRVIELQTRGNCRGAWDGQRLQQVLGNLVENALKYGSPDSAITVTLAADAGDLRFDVCNQGEAMDTAALEEMFEPLKQGQAAEHARGDGLGLGLYIVREIAKGHGGDVRVQSRDGQTRFSVQIPRRMAAA